MEKQKRKVGRPKAEIKKIPASFTVSPSVNDEFRAYCDANGVFASRVIEEFMKTFPLIGKNLLVTGKNSI